MVGLLAVTATVSAGTSLGHIGSIALMFDMESERTVENEVTATSTTTIQQERDESTTTSNTVAVPTTVVPSSLPSDPTTTVLQAPSTTVPETTVPSFPTVPEVTVPTLPTVPELPDTSTDASFLNETNAERTAALQWSNELEAYARVHVLQMMVAGYLFHSDISRLLTHWEFVGENVGVGTSVEAIQEAYMNSPTHAKNVTEPKFTHYGSHSETDLSGRIWTASVYAA